MQTIHLQQKRALIILLLGTLFIFGHYYCYTAEIPMLWLVRLVVRVSLLLLCLCGMIFLIFHSRDIRSRKVFAVTLGLYAFASAISLIVGILHHGQTLQPQLLSPAILLYGNTYVYIFLLYPIALLNLAKLSIWRYISILLPAVGLGAIYYAVVYLRGEPMTEIHSWQDLITNIGRFDVWFRFTIFVYPLWMMFKIIRYKANYLQWCQENYSDSGYVDLAWINYYIFGYFLLLCSYCIVILGNNPQSMVMHLLCFLTFFTFCLIKIIHQATPIPTRYTPLDEEMSQPTTCLSDEAYKAKLEEWMSRTKPYLDKDFKLLDVMNALQLEKNDLTRLFKDIYGDTFLDFTMRFRIAESLRQFKMKPDATTEQIALYCGFSSATLFNRAFIKIKGVDPEQYRKDHPVNDNKEG
ncbi:MAG: helix-turn-helix domain-containing protein [Alistipes sp.]